MKINDIIFKIKKHAPEELMIIGIAGFVGTVVLACKASFKAEEVLDKHKEMMDEIKQAEEAAPDEYSLEDAKNDKIHAYISTAISFGKLYAPAAMIGAASITSVILSHNILKNRYLGAVAAYNFIAGAFARYRERVKEEYGEDVDRHLRYGTNVEVIETEYVDEKGKTKKKKETVETLVDGHSEYAVYFDNTSSEWERNPEYCLWFLYAKEEILNHILRSRGNVLLNDVYDELGLPRTPRGCVVGWKLGNKEGDDYISFGLPEKGSEDYMRLIRSLSYDNYEILLDFNVDGVIWDSI